MQNTNPGEPKRARGAGLHDAFEIAWPAPMPGAQQSFMATECLATTVRVQPDDLADGVLRGYATMDANKTYSVPSSKWRASAWIKNMFDQKLRMCAESNARSGREIPGGRRVFGSALSHDL